MTDRSGPKTFWDSVIDQHIGQSESLQDQLLGDDYRKWERPIQNALLPRKVKRLEKEVEDLKAGHGPALSSREKKIWSVIQTGAKGLQYCRELHNARLKPRRSWKEEGCPSSYPEAYRSSSRWQQRINDEKSKVRRKAEASATSR